MSLQNPRGFTDEVTKATLSDPQIAANEVAARRRSLRHPGVGGWRDFLAVGVGVAVLAVFIGSVIWTMLS